MRKKLLGSKNTEATARREGAVFLQFTRENFEKEVVKKSLPQEARKLPQFLLASRRHKKLFILSVLLEEVCGVCCLFIITSLVALNLSSL